MTIAFSCDHGGYPFRDQILAHLRNSGHEVLDLSPVDFDELDDFPGFAQAVSQEVLSGKVQRGVLVCGTGVGMSIAANRHEGIRAALGYSPEVTHMSRQHNDANVICFGARTMDIDSVLESLETFLTTDFIGGKYQKRNEMIECLGGTC